MTEIVKMRGEGLETVGRWGGRREDGEWWYCLFRGMSKMPVLVSPSTLESYKQFSALVKRLCTLVSRSQTLSWRSTPQLASFPAMFPGSPGTLNVSTPARLQCSRSRAWKPGNEATPQRGVAVSLVPRLPEREH